MSDPVNALLTAVHQRLTEDADLVALVGNAIFDRRLSRKVLPALVTGHVERTDRGADGGGVAEIALSYEAWGESRREAEAVAGVARAALDEARLSLVDGLHLVSLDHLKTLSRRPVGSALFVAEMRFRAAVEG